MGVLGKKRNKKELVKCKKLYYEYILRGGFIAALSNSLDFAHWIVNLLYSVFCFKTFAEEIDILRT